MHRFEGKVFIVTGGGSGIGAACARQLAREGGQVAVIGRRKHLIAEVAHAIGGWAIEADAADAEAMNAAVARVLAEGGRLDGLIASAGGFGNGAATETSDEEWNASFRANLSTAFVSARACLPALVQSRGNVVLVSSIAGLAAGPQVCGYTTFKHGLIGLARSIARDYGRLGVRANTVCPGWVRTPMADEEMKVLMEKFGFDLDQAYGHVTTDVPLGRPATAGEIAEVCLFLASEQASVVTGAVLAADGGSTIVDVPTLAFAH